MKTDSGPPVNVPPSSESWGRRIFKRPSTPLGWWAVGLAALFEILMMLNSAIFMRLPEDVPWRLTVLPFYGIFMMMCGLVAGIVALVALLRQHERSWLVWLALGIGLTALVFVLGEFILPH